MNIGWSWTEFFKIIYDEADDGAGPVLWIRVMTQMEGIVSQCIHRLRSPIHYDASTILHLDAPSSLWIISIDTQTNNFYLTRFYNSQSLQHDQCNSSNEQTNATVIVWRSVPTSRDALVVCGVRVSGAHGMVSPWLQTPRRESPRKSTRTRTLLSTPPRLQKATLRSI